MAIINYVWFLGIGHAGTLISALLLITNRNWRNSLNRFAEAMTLCAVVCAGLYPILHLGRPWYFYWIAPYFNSMHIWPQFKSPLRSEEHTSELQSLMRISYAVFCLKKK